jgi:hypothetical protein
MVCVVCGPARRWIVHCYFFRLVSTGQGAWRSRPPDWRRGYVERQLSIARQALCLGSAAAARAALRVLSGEDFADTRTATEFLRTLRDRTSDDDAVVQALHRLCSLEPRGDDMRVAETA